jgi:hypothetical protein
MPVQKPGPQIIDQAIAKISEGYAQACRTENHQSPPGTRTPALDYVSTDKIRRILKKVPEDRLRNLPLNALGATIGAKLAESTKKHRIADDFLYAFFRPRVNKVNIVTVEDNRRQLEAVRRDVSDEEVPNMSREQTRAVRDILKDAGVL